MQVHPEYRNYGNSADLVDRYGANWVGVRWVSNRNRIGSSMVEIGYLSNVFDRLKNLHGFAMSVTCSFLDIAAL